MLIGTARYVSINTHLGIEQSRRDDLESIGYVLVFFLKGSLPWQGLKVGNDKYTRIMEKKLQIPTEILCYGLPDEIVHYLNYCKSLRFEDRPDYDYLRTLFIKLLGTCTSLYGLTKEYLRFDWCFDDPMSSIWAMYSRKKNSDKFKKESKEKVDTPIGSSGKDEDHIISDSDNKSGKESDDEKSNLKLIPANNDRDSINDSSSIAEKDSNNSVSIKKSLSKSNKKQQSSIEDSYNSEDTVEVEFNGIENTQTFEKQYTPEEIHQIFDTPGNEEIEKYISDIVNSKKFKYPMETPVMGGRNRSKLKDSLDVVSKDVKLSEISNGSRKKKKKIN